VFCCWGLFCWGGVFVGGGRGGWVFLYGCCIGGVFFWGGCWLGGVRFFFFGLFCFGGGCWVVLCGWGFVGGVFIFFFFLGFFFEFGFFCLWVGGRVGGGGGGKFPIDKVSSGRNRPGERQRARQTTERMEVDWPSQKKKGVLA